MDYTLKPVREVNDSLDKVLGQRPEPESVTSLRAVAPRATNASLRMGRNGTLRLEDAP